MEIGLNLPVANPSVTPEILRAVAIAAEAKGFAELYLGEHVVLFDKPSDRYPSSDDGEAFFPATAPLPDPLVTHAFIASCTTRVRLATGVMLLPQRNPVYTAKHVATLDWLSGGRFDCTIGLGWSSEEFEACDVPWAERGARAEDYIGVMRSLWSDPVSSYEGRFYSLKPCRQYPKPVQRPYPPLWFGGWTDAALNRTARLGNGWYGFDQTAEAIAERVARLRAFVAEQGRAMESVKISCGGYSLQPASIAELRAYHDAGVRQFVFTLTETEPARIMEQIDFLAGEFVAKAASW
jgi:probable F420-dependent oxidoreductase